MVFNYDFYIASSVVLLVLIIYFFSVPKVSSPANKCFGAFMILCFICCFADMISGSILMRYFHDRIALNYIGQMISFSAQHLAAPVYVLYMFILTRELEEKKLQKKDWILALPALSDQIIIWSTPLTNLAFSYTKENGYQRGPAFVYLIVVAVFYLVVGSYQIIAHGKRMGTQYRLISAAFFIISVTFLAIQMVNAEYVLLGAAGALSCLIMQLSLQNPQLIKEANERETAARKQAEKSNEAKSTFVANISHELRTPLNAICGMAEILQEAELSAIEQEYVKTIQDASKSLIDIIDDVLDFSKIDAGKSQLVIEEYEFAHLLTNLEDLVAAYLQEKGLRFEINIGDGAPKRLCGDREKVQQILGNLLENAVKFTEKGKVVFDVSFQELEEDRLRMEFRITDTGIGIKEEDMGKLFSQFSQIDTRKNRKFGGTGLGLVLSKRLANLMGGDVTVKSEYGMGSCFTVRLDQQLVEKEQFPDRSVGSKIHTFILEEDYDARWYLTRLLSQFGISAVMLQNADQLQGIREEDYDADQTVVFYSYEKYYGMVQAAELPYRTVALLNYFTTVGKNQQIDEYMRKPFDVFKIRQVLFEPKRRKRLKKRNKLKVQNVRVAIVDDNKVNLRVAATLLREFGIIPEAFVSGAGILKALGMGRKYDLIFMDHMMPEMDGVETTKKIREINGKYAKNVPIVALTANAVDGIGKEYLEAGMNDWLFKPVDMERFQEKLLKYLPSEKVVTDRTEIQDLQTEH
ncbi:MAG: ATP-binding protein [Clostridiaceae bacterium]|nr:ATP-binding protein [Clostridiaceae bacterium]